MKLITKNTDYAIRALSFMAKRKNDIISVSELVKKLSISRPFLRKILQILNKEGFLKSYKGIGGGFKLAQRPDRIFVIDLINIFQGPFKINNCILKANVCPEVRDCVLKKRIDNIERYIIRELRSITIKTLLQ